jgi:hypothetical protein
MKKIIAILVIFTMVAMATPAVIGVDDGYDKFPCDCYDDPWMETIKTQVSVEGSLGGEVPPGTPGEGSGAPIIKCKWEYDLRDCGEGPCGTKVHDACYMPGLQIGPTLSGDTLVGFYAVVTDIPDRDDVAQVSAHVWHPDGTYKYKIRMERVERGESLAIWNHILDHHMYDDIVAWSGLMIPPPNSKPGWEWEDVYWQLSEHGAYLYRGYGLLNYCQPAGCYGVEVHAADYDGNWAKPLWNTFWYIPTAAVDYDFEKIRYDYQDGLYAPVPQCKWIWVDGDYNMLEGDERPTVRNIGNCPVYFMVEQDNMGFSKYIDPYGYEIWEVEYDAQLGEDPNVVKYDPFVCARIPGVLELCTLDKLDFSIHVRQGYPEHIYEGNMWLDAYIDTDSYLWDTPSEFIGTPNANIPQDIGPIQGCICGEKVE